MDSEKHKAYTGVSNALILKNVSRISSSGIPILIRVPLIPGYNDFEENIRLTAEFTKTLKSAIGIELLQYHRLGEAKYRRLDMDYALSGIEAQSEDEMHRLRELAAGFLDGEVCDKTGVIGKNDSAAFR
jgi:pyruvate formate lyase activating enzyme